MFKNYFKIAFRNLRKNKGYSFISIGGLTPGMTVAMLISFWVHDELSFNKYHENYDSIAQVLRIEQGQNQIYTNSATVTGLGTLLRSEYATHFKTIAMVRARIENRFLAFEEKKFTQSGYFMQPEGAEMFTLKMVSGTRNGLQDLSSILLSQSLAQKLFGERDPINKIVKMAA